MSDKRVLPMRIEEVTPQGRVLATLAKMRALSAAGLEHSNALTDKEWEQMDELADELYTRLRPFLEGDEP